jgi:hypothetical protein
MNIIILSTDNLLKYNTEYGYTHTHTHTSVSPTSGTIMHHTQISMIV